MFYDTDNRQIVEPHHLQLLYIGNLKIIFHEKTLCSKLHSTHSLNRLPVISRILYHYIIDIIVISNDIIDVRHRPLGVCCKRPEVGLAAITCSIV